MTKEIAIGMLKVATTGDKMLQILDCIANPNLQNNINNMIEDYAQSVQPTPGTILDAYGREVAF